MTTSRRAFLEHAAQLGALAGLGATLPGLAGAMPAAAPAATPPRAAQPTRLRILILGGTGFIGPHQVRYAVERGHQVTLFNRGRTNPGLFPDVETLLGDRAVGDYRSLAGREWDVVIDNPTTLPRWAREAAAAVKGRAAHYLFISTMSVYAANATPDADESAALATTDTPNEEDPERSRALYGPLKALSEGEVRRAFPTAHTIIRPGSSSARGT